MEAGKRLFGVGMKSGATVASGFTDHLRALARRRHRVARSRELLRSWVGENFGRLLSGEELDALRDALRKVLSAHGRWDTQMTYLRGEGPHPDRAR